MRLYRHFTGGCWVVDRATSVAISSAATLISLEYCIMPIVRLVKKAIAARDRKIGLKAVEKYKRSLELPTGYRPINQKTGTLTDNQLTENPKSDE